MLFIAVTVAFGVLIYMFVQRVIVMKPVGIASVDEAIDALIERQRMKGEGSRRRRKGGKARSWESASLSEHTMDIIESLEATTCPTETRSAATSTAVSMGSQASKEASTALEFDKTFSPNDAAAKQEEGGAKKAHRHHHHKRHHRHRSRAEEKERSADSDEGVSGEGEEDERRSKGGHKRHRKHRSKDVVPGPRLDAPLLVTGETLPGPDAVDVEMRSLEAVKTP